MGICEQVKIGCADACNQREESVVNVVLVVAVRPWCWLDNAWTAWKVGCGVTCAVLNPFVEMHQGGVARVAVCGRWFGVCC